MIAYDVVAATSRHADVVVLRNETTKDVLLNGLKPQIVDLVWNRPIVNEKTYLEIVELAEECKKVVKIKKIAKNKDLSSAVTLILKENEKKRRRNKQPKRTDPKTDNIYFATGNTARRKINKRLK